MRGVGLCPTPAGNGDQRRGARSWELRRRRVLALRKGTYEEPVYTYARVGGPMDPRRLGDLLAGKTGGAEVVVDCCSVVGDLVRVAWCGLGPETIKQLAADATLLQAGFKEFAEEGAAVGGVWKAVIRSRILKPITREVMVRIVQACDVRFGELRAIKSKKGTQRECNWMVSVMGLTHDGMVALCRNKQIRDMGCVAIPNLQQAHAAGEFWRAPVPEDITRAPGVMVELRKMAACYCAAMDMDAMGQVHAIVAAFDPPWESELACGGSRFDMVVRWFLWAERGGVSRCSRLRAQGRGRGRQGKRTPRWRRKSGWGWALRVPPWWRLRSEGMVEMAKSLMSSRWFWLAVVGGGGKGG